MKGEGERLRELHERLRRSWPHKAAKGSQQRFQPARMYTMAKSDCDDSGTDSPQLWQRQSHMTHIYSIIVADMLRRTIYTIYTAPRKYANCCINLESRWTTHTHKHKHTDPHTYICKHTRSLRVASRGNNQSTQAKSCTKI